MFGAKKENNLPKGKGASSSAHNSLVFGTVITGNLKSKTDIRIDGKLEGNLESEAKVVVGKNALIVGNIVCESILIEGRIEGNITARGCLHIQSAGTVFGDLRTNKLIIEDGAVFDGASIMKKTSSTQTKNGQEGSSSNKKQNVQKAS
ncbi:MULTISPECIES: polymer-forming cytoskeletal protein [unclassified Aureispira]|uniref:bactofilin family protein n=1 Tax=unclassified Aureispira TaxID=2649989 RepID=UPI0006963EDD|nr:MULTISPECIES: polymer-forming cytoskeletal protein [unclassified Aureispira]WMX12933.1 polymer-forming cytoskeletal protein [Aureispira sp. CCB-E]